MFRHYPRNGLAIGMTFVNSENLNKRQGVGPKPRIEELSPSSQGRCDGFDRICRRAVSPSVVAQLCVQKFHLVPGGLPLELTDELFQRLEQRGSGTRDSATDDDCAG